MRIAVIGAGSVGCYLGGRLAAAPTAMVMLVGRPHVLEPIAEHGLSVGTDDGAVQVVPAARLHLATDPHVAAGADVVLVTTKSLDTAEAVRTVAHNLRPGVPVVSFQNGLRNPGRIRQELRAAGRDNPVVPGVVGYNVARTGPASFIQTTSGELLVADAPAALDLVALASTAGLPIRTRPDMTEVAAAKVLLNLNNAVNALSGMPLAAQLRDRDFRRVLAGAQREALVVFAAEGIRPARLTPLPVSFFPRVLDLPTALFTRAAGATLRVGPQARSSMADDLALGRRTEIEDLQGEIVRRGAQVGLPTPVSAALVELVHEAETAGQSRRVWGGAELRAEVGRRGGIRPTA